MFVGIQRADKAAISSRKTNKQTKSTFISVLFCTRYTDISRNLPSTFPQVHSRTPFRTPFVQRFVFSGGQYILSSQERRHILPHHIQACTHMDHGHVSYIREELNIWQPSKLKYDFSRSDLPKWWMNQSTKIYSCGISFITRGY